MEVPHRIATKIEGKHRGEDAITPCWSRIAQTKLGINQVKNVRIIQAFLVSVACQVFAICAMRSIYTLVNHAISDLPYLKPAVALVLGFVGGKMFAEFFHHDIGIGVSLGVVSACRWSAF